MYAARTVPDDVLPRRVHSTIRDMSVRPRRWQPLASKGTREYGRCPARTGDLLLVRHEHVLPSAAVCRSNRLGERYPVPSCCALLRFVASTALPHARSCSHARLSHKGDTETPLRARGRARQSNRARRPRDGRPARDGRDGRFRSPPLERIQGARQGFMRQPHAKAQARPQELCVLASRPKGAVVRWRAETPASYRGGTALPPHRTARESPFHLTTEGRLSRPRR